MERIILREGGREFQVDDPENARLVLNKSIRGRGLYRSIRGSGEIKLFEADLHVELLNSE